MTADNEALWAPSPPPEPTAEDLDAATDLADALDAPEAAPAIAHDLALCRHLAEAEL